MKKFMTVLFVVFVFAASFSIQSCKKCTTCTYNYDVLGQPQTYSYPELCGSNSDIDTYKAACNDAAALVSGTCTCIDN